MIKKNYSNPIRILLNFEHKNVFLNQNKSTSSVCRSVYTLSLIARQMHAICPSQAALQSAQRSVNTSHSAWQFCFDSQQRTIDGPSTLQLYGLEFIITEFHVEFTESVYASNGQRIYFSMTVHYSMDI